MVDDPYLTALPAAVYATDADGHLTYSNDAALELWGRRPNAREALWCGALRLWRTDGTPLDHADCPLARLLKGEAFPRGSELVIERPDGGRTPVRSYPKLIHDKDGQVTGAVNLLIDLSDEHALVIESERLAAIVSSSDDAIVGKTLEGIVTSWNGAATRIFGYEPQEMIGQPILTIIPAELQHEEARILAALRRGERIEHFDTVRLAKDGHRVEVSLTVSPIRDRSGTIVGASKVARDISQRRRQEELQKLLLDELNHRVKNTLAMIQAIASQSLRRSAGPNEFVASFQGRVQALARAHDLIVQRRLGGAELDAARAEPGRAGIRRCHPDHGGGTSPGPRLARGRADGPGFA